MKDKYKATWVSYSSISDYIRCPRAYYLKNIYRNPITNRKISLMQPGLALGQIIHEIFEDISFLPVADRLSVPLIDIYKKKWIKRQGMLGGFRTKEEEDEYKKRGEQMIDRVIRYPGPILRKAVKLRQDLPYYWLSEEDNIILCGKIDWLEYIEEQDSVRIIDFKTGKFDEESDSLQLPIYLLLASNVQKRPILGIQYWYLSRDDKPIDVEIPDLQSSKQIILDIAKKISLARKLERFVCSHKEGCLYCRPYENIIKGHGQLIGTDNFNQDLYVLLG